jgi:S-DNA-T family DNA segregation ATPase FtsK/SpoIIIE
MAETKKKTKKVTSQKETSLTGTTDRKRQTRLGFGLFFLLLGIFTCFSIISYCFTWQADQDKVYDMHGLYTFLFHGRTEVANWGGRMGAALSHILIYRGIGIAAFAIGIGLMMIGLNLLNSKRAVPVMRYMRWLSILLLIIAPILSYLMPNAAFSYGGAWGNVAISYLNGFLGQAGTGLILLAILCFFVFVIFALDITPLLRRMKDRAKTVAAALTPAPAFAEAPANIEEAPALTTNDEIPAKKEWDMSVVEKPLEKKTINDLYASNDKETADHLIEDTDEHIEDAESVEEADSAEEDTVAAVQDTGISFEVFKQAEERSVIKNGGHISIGSNEPYAPELDLPSYKFPTLDLLEDRAQEAIALDKEELEKNKNQIIQTLRSFGIEIQRISATIGPTVTLYEIVPAEGVRISKIRNLEDDIALNLAALGIRIIAPIPGRGTIGIEVPNANKQIVSMRALLASEKFANTKMSLPIALGKKIDNENYIVDLATMPHLLMAGATGQGKSVGINAILVSLLYKKHPSQLKFVMVDPKKVELSIYRTIEKHFLAKLPNEEEAIITDTKKVIYTLNALCIEMDNRYELLKEAGARNIKEYNEKFISRKLNPERGHKYLPFIVLVIDEFADLIMTAGKEVEMPIARLAQLARAIGIHLIIATQRPSVNVITGTIKANFPARIAFKVSAKVDSRTILDTGGAEQLIGRGDMLVSHGSELLRLQCAFVDTPEVEHIVNFIGKQRGYPSAFELPEYEGEESDEAGRDIDLSNRDKLFEDCARVVVQTQSGSTSMLQRRFNLGYNRAGRIMDQLEAAGIVGPAMGSKPRDVIFKTEAELAQFLSSLN